MRLLSAEEEGRLAWIGAVSALPDPPESVAVCDVGGRSTEVVIGTPERGPAWLRSFNFGSLRLTQRLVKDDPPGAEALDAVRAEVAEVLDALVAPIPRAALATGGTARALVKMTGPRLDAPQLDYAVRRLATRPAREITKRYRVEPVRALTLPAGGVILKEVQRRLEIPLHVWSRAGAPGESGRRLAINAFDLLGQRMVVHGRAGPWHSAPAAGAGSETESNAEREHRQLMAVYIPRS